VAEAASALPWHPGQVTLEHNERSADELAELVDNLDDAPAMLLDRLVSGSPVGRTKDAAAGAPPDSPVQLLLTAGLLRQLDEQTVILPRSVGQVLRGEEVGPVDLVEPIPSTSTTSKSDVDAAAAGAVVDLLREVEVLLENFGATPASTSSGWAWSLNFARQRA